MRFRLPALGLSAALAAAACNDATVTQPSTPAAAPDVSVFAWGGVHVLPPRDVVAANVELAPRARTKSSGILYHGGPILRTPQVAAIYWGTTTIYQSGPTPGSHGSGTGDKSVVGYFLNHFAPSGYFNINSTYTDGSGGNVANSVAYTQYWADNSSPGSKPSDAAIQAEVVKGFTNGLLSFDASTVYLVFTGPGVNLGGGFGSQYCAYHGHFSWSGHDVKYAAEPYNWDFPSGCSALSGSPNGDPAADAEVNTIAHETEEAATDPDLNAWYDRRGYENADKCAWTFGATYTTSNGATANMRLGTSDFLIQRNWVNAGSGGCALTYP